MEIVKEIFPDKEIYFDRDDSKARYKLLEAIYEKKMFNDGIVCGEISDFEMTE